MRTLKALSLLAALNIASGEGEVSQIYSQPVVGILMYPVIEDGDARSESKLFRPPPKTNMEGSQEYKGYFDASYVQWLNQGGARVAAIPYDLPSDELEKLLSKLNGVLFTGGPGMPEDIESYYNTAVAIYNMVLSANDYLPLWGTCLGFEVICSIAGGGEDAVLSNYDAEDISLALDLTDAADSSRLFGSAGDSILSALSNANITTNWHMYGVSPETFDSAVSPSGLVSLSTNVDKQGKTFVSTLEHSSAPIYATQWHPEANQYDVDDKEGFFDTTPSRAAEAVQVMQYLSNTFVDETRRNERSFDNEDDFHINVLDLNDDDVYFDGWVYWFK